ATDGYCAAGGFVNAARLGRTQGSLCAGDEDWFQINVAVGETFAVSAHFFNSAGDVDLLLYRDQDGNGAIDPTERIDASRNVTDCESVSNADDTTDSTYWLLVRGAEINTSQEDYRLSWDANCQQEEPQRPFCL
ncbi:MAG: hypothetical protein AAFX99_34875, partial [Myxococcota bacterium]